MLWVPTSIASTTRQSSATSASGDEGAPVASVVQACCAKRCAIGTPPARANSCDTSIWPARSQFTLSTPLALMTALAALRRLMHTSTVGGVSLTDETAEHVTPA